MRVLIAEDDVVSRCLLEATLVKWGYDVVVTNDGWYAHTTGPYQHFAIARARAVEEFLISNNIPQVQLTVISYGKERPVCTDESESCWQRNRRAHVTAAP